MIFSIPPSIRIPDEWGMTLVEIMAAIAISGMFMAGAFTTAVHCLRIYHTQERAAAMQQNLRAAVFYLEREIRMAGLDPLGTAAAGILRAEPNLIRFSEDADGDGTISYNEDITYTLGDSNGDGIPDELERNSWTVAENIMALTFEYLDRSGAPAASLGEIRAVRLNLAAATKIDGHTKSMTAFVGCRNLGL